MHLHDNPWAPYQPGPGDEWDVGKVAHLHRRAGFGMTWAELKRDLHDGPAASVERFLKPRAVTADETLVLDSLKQGVLDSRDVERLKAWWLYRILYDTDPLREKMTLFWHGHFATSNRKVNSIPLMLEQNELLRKHALGRFGDLVSGIVSDGAMLVWLDGFDSRKERPNENFARELMELFTLGVGHYSEKDVREAARAFTGWVKDSGDSFNGDYKFHYEGAGFDDGPKTFLGKAGRWKPADVVRIILEQPACADFLCRKLYRFFVSEAAAPPDALIRPLADEFRKSGYDVRHLLGVILRSRYFYSREVRRQRILSPVEWSAGLVRSLDVPRANVSLLALAAACERQGQELFYPPNVKGWDGGRTWLNSTTVLERGNWAADVIWGNADYGIAPYEPPSWARGQPLVELLLQDDAHPHARELIRRAAEPRQALQLIVNCPEYQLG